MQIFVNPLMKKSCANQFSGPVENS